jgi:WhiB family redox-sensing transcriptional regulator
LDPLTFTLSNGLRYEEGTPPSCAEASPDIFFPEETEDENGKLISAVYTHEIEAKEICVKCPYRVACLLAAMKTNDVGIWGGTTETERKRIRRERSNPATFQVKFKNNSKSRRS